MKKFCFALLFFWALNLIYPPAAFAAEQTFVLTEGEVQAKLEAGEVTYARILKDETCLYSNSALTDVLFCLPKTYFVQVLEYGKTACPVIYCMEDYDYARGVSGYVRTDELTFVSAPPTGRSFPNVFAKFEGNGTFYKNNKFDAYYSAAETSALGEPFFYGYYFKGGEKYCYVLRGGRFGYYSAEVFSQIEIPPHPDALPATRLPQENSSPDEEIEKSGGFFASDTNKAIFIVVCCLVAVSVVSAMFLPKKTMPEEEEE